MNGAALMRRGAGLKAIFFGGGTTVHLYSLVPGNVADDDFGNINPYYTTYFFVDSEEEGAYQLGSGPQHREESSGRFF
jgi:hypothetical protein